MSLNFGQGEISDNGRGKDLISSHAARYSLREWGKADLEGMLNSSYK
jgi:hypothetical protein